MRTVEEFVLLLGETLSLWRRFFLQMGTWFCLGFAVHHLGVQLSAVLSFRQGLLSTLVFVAGLLGFLIALILMIHVLGQGLRTPRRVQPDADAAGTLTIPHRVFETERRLDVVTSALGPFLAVYAVWGFVDEEVEELFFANLSQVGIGNPLEWSISFAPERFGFYLMLAVVSWTLGKILTALLARRRTPWLAVPNVFTDGVLVFAIFVVLVIAAKTVREWIATRVVTVEVLGGIGRLVDALPAWQLPFDLTLPEAVRELWTWLWGTLAPAVGEGLLLPLMWLALTATVFGWRRFRGQDLVAGTPLQRTAERFAGRKTSRGSQALINLATDDLRTKYIPVGQALRLIWRAGPRFVGAYLLLATMINFGHQWFIVGVTMIIGPQPETVALAVEPFTELITELIFTTLAVSLYAAAFDRALADVTDQTRQSAPARTH